MPDENGAEETDPVPTAPEVTLSATGNGGDAGLAHDGNDATFWSPAQDRDVITLSLGGVRSVREIVITTNTGFTLSGDSASFADSPLEITSDGDDWIAVPLINFNNLANSCDITSFDTGLLACGFEPPRVLSQVRFEVRQEQLVGVASARDVRIYELDVEVVDTP